jgi:hypothetical protein
MKTTDKRHPVYPYILNCINENLKEEYLLENEPETDQEKLQFVFDTFKSEYGFNINRYGLQGAFKEWLSGLPSVIHIDFENYKILELAEKWESLPKNASESKQDKLLLNWFNFITVKFFQLCKRNKVIVN